jgi:NRAMP (natural resistance-associated macrophage protein)-like metal ion transporter
MGGEVDSRSASDAALPAIAPIGGGTSVAVGTSKPRLLQILGPGLITGASDDDPSGIGTYSQAGAQLGFGITWTMLFTYPLMAAIQEISARVGRVTGRGLAGNICRHYPGWMLQTMVFSLFAANSINIGADLGAMGDATKLLIGGSATGFVLMFGVVCVIAQVFVQYARYVRVLKWLSLSLFAYVAALAAVRVPWAEALKGFFLPRIEWNSGYLTTLVAIAGRRFRHTCFSGKRRKRRRTCGLSPRAHR